MRFLLDTDSVSYALRGEGRVAENMLSHRPSELAISALTLAELRFGADRRRSRRLHRLIDAFARDVAVVAFEATAASRYGKLASALVAAGSPIGTLDTLIAAHALSLDLVLVTHNVRHFRRVADLRTVDWY